MKPSQVNQPRKQPHQGLFPHFRPAHPLGTASSHPEARRTAPVFEQGYNQSTYGGASPHPSPRASRACTTRNPPSTAPAPCATSSPTPRNRTTKSRNRARPKSRTGNRKIRLADGQGRRPCPAPDAERPDATDARPADRRQPSWPRNTTTPREKLQQAEKMREAFKARQQPSHDHEHDRER